MDFRRALVELGVVFDNGSILGLIHVGAIAIRTGSKSCQPRKRERNQTKMQSSARDCRTSALRKFQPKTCKFRCNPYEFIERPVIGIILLVRWNAPDSRQPTEIKRHHARAPINSYTGKCKIRVPSNFNHLRIACGTASAKIAPTRLEGVAAGASCLASGYTKRHRP